MLELMSTYWPHFLALLSIGLGTAAAIHATMTKEEVRSAIGWVGVIVLSPIVGALIYAVVGINRIRSAKRISHRFRAAHRGRKHLSAFDASNGMVAERFGRRFEALKTLGDRVARHPLTRGNSIETLETGDEAYSAMQTAIETAERSILLETYIFDRDQVGLRIADALIAAVARGVCVRVLVDAVGARYSVPSIAGYLQKGGVPFDVFNGNIIIGLRLPYANLRTHRKILVVDGKVAFVGGMNIRQGFSAEFSGDLSARDTHFRVKGPVVADFFAIAAEDWHFATDESLETEEWQIATPQAGDTATGFMRAVSTGPDGRLETNHRMVMGAFSVARDRIRIMSPYFLPDRELISALVTAARRGVQVDIVVPAKNNLTLVDHAMTAQFDQMLKNYCRIWRAEGAFNHSKLLSIDGTWAYVGSSNMDPRSLRLNFEVDLEVFEPHFAKEIDRRMEEAIAQAKPVMLEALMARPFLLRLVDKVLWLGSPYL